LRYPKEVVLKDRTEAIIRPLEKSDESKLGEFYAAIPESDRWYMKYDAMDPAVIRQWVDSIDTGDVFSTVVVSDDRIIAHARLHMGGSGSTRHVGQLRIMVLPEYRHKRLGTWMLLDLIQLGMDKGLNDMRADFVVGVEDGAVEAARRLDFFENAVLKEYVKSPNGTRHDLLVMIKRLHRSWSDF
jgi:GNAT superfamily N-acetyltransferase